MNEKEVTIKFFGRFRELTSRKEYSLAPGRAKKVNDALKALQDEVEGLRDEFLDENGNLLSRVNVFINGENILAKSGLDTGLKGGDTLAIFPPMGGG